jgi:HSP20 family molecular chaperone IbpA
MGESKDIVKKEETSQELTRQFPSISPAVDIYENEDEILLYADMPGATKDDISVNIDNGTMVLSGMRKLETSGAVTWEEFSDVQYRRTFSVPQTIDIDKVDAELKDGVLRLHLPKSEAAKPKQIEIKAV